MNWGYNKQETSWTKHSHELELQMRWRNPRLINEYKLISFCTAYNCECNILTAIDLQIAPSPDCGYLVLEVSVPGAVPQGGAQYGSAGWAVPCTEPR